MLNLIKRKLKLKFVYSENTPAPRVSLKTHELTARSSARIRPENF